MDLLAHFDAFEPEEPRAGALLLAEPFMADRFFRRSVILLCEMGDEAAMGYQLNVLLKQRLQDVLPVKLDVDYPLYLGGPVEQNSLHCVHRLESLACSSYKIADGLYMGLKLEPLLELLSGKHPPAGSEIRFFMGYTGWSSEQLTSELSERSWIVCNTFLLDQIFETARRTLWSDVLRAMKGDYARFAHYPMNPTLN